MSPVNEAHVTRIPEKISENQQGRGRGRPRVMEAMRAVLEMNDVGTDYRSERQRVNRAYALDAIRRLGGGEDPAFFWLVNYVEQDRRPHNVFVKREQSTILAELGRIADDGALLAAARRICEQKPTTKDAIAMLRHWRRGQQPQGHADDLTRRLIALITGYLEGHAGVDNAMILEALTVATLVIEDALGDEQP